MKTELLFKNLFARALKDWPESLDFELQTQKFEEVVPTDKEYELVRYKNLPWDKNFENYTIKGLYDLCESIEKKYYNHPEEVLMRDLHTTIDGILRDLAKSLTHVVLKDLRPEIVQKNFEASRKKALDNQEEYKDDLYWEEQDFQMARDYFAVNYPDKK